MTSEAKISAPRRRPILLSPWLVALVALALYGLTLNHWVTLRSVQMVSQITGWDWHPLPASWRGEPIAPLFWILTYPVRLLPVALQPVCLNAFTALCAALTLGPAGGLGSIAPARPHARTAPTRRRRIRSALVSHRVSAAALCRPDAGVPTHLLAACRLGQRRNARLAGVCLFDILHTALPDFPK